MYRKTIQIHTPDDQQLPSPGPKSLLLLGHTDGTSTATGGLGVLTAHTQAPVVTQTTVGTDLLQSLQILTQFGINVRGGQLRVLAINDVLLSVEEPIRDLVLTRVRDDGDDLLNLKQQNTRRSVNDLGTNNTRFVELTSSSEHSPARLKGSTSAFFRTTWA